MPQTLARSPNCQNCPFCQCVDVPSGGRAWVCYHPGPPIPLDDALVATTIAPGCPLPPLFQITPVQPRVYLVLTFLWKGQWGVLVNRKRLMPEHLRVFEGTTLFPGGGMEPGESEQEALARELVEACSWQNPYPQQRLPLEAPEEVYYTSHIPLPHPQRLYRMLAGVCKEGTLDLVLESHLNAERWAVVSAGVAARLAIESARGRADGLELT